MSAIVGYYCSKFLIHVVSKFEVDDAGFRIRCFGRVAVPSGASTGSREALSCVMG